MGQRAMQNSIWIDRHISPINSSEETRTHQFIILWATIGEVTTKPRPERQVRSWMTNSTYTIKVLFGSCNGNANGNKITSFPFPCGNIHNFNFIPLTLQFYNQTAPEVHTSSSLREV